MHVTNIHQRRFNRSKDELGMLLESLASDLDQLWPHEIWPRMVLDNGLNVGSKGGHSPIKYEVVEHKPNDFVRFKFKAPDGFNGYHQFEVKALGEAKSELVHTIKTDIVGKGILTWYLAILHLHNALLRDLLAKAEGSLGLEPQVSPWNMWVKFLRFLFAGGKSRKQTIPEKVKA